MDKKLLIFLWLITAIAATQAAAQTVVRFNLAGYTPSDKKILVVASKQANFSLRHYKLVSTASDSAIISRSAFQEKDFGRFGPFEHSYRIDIASIITPGNYQLFVNDTIVSQTIHVKQDAYHGMADFCLSFFRNQRCSNITQSGDSLHLWENYMLGQSPTDSTPVDVSGGWHSTINDVQDIFTGATITGFLMSAYQRYPLVFNDSYNQLGAKGKNSSPDILDETKWGLDWLIKMHPTKDRIYVKAGSAENEAAESSYNTVPRVVEAAFDSTRSALQVDASLVSAVFADGATLLGQFDPNYASRLRERAENTYQWAQQSGSFLFSQKVAAENLYRLTNNKKYLPVKNVASSIAGNPLLFADLSKNTLLYWKPELEKILRQAEKNAFYFPMNFDSASNVLLVNMAVAALRYRVVSGDATFRQLEQTAMDWLLGCNPWGVAIIAGLPVTTSVSSPYHATALNNFSGSLVTGPVAQPHWKKRSGVSLLKKDALDDFQSVAALYHDDAADYVTNLSSLEGTAAMVLLLASRENESLNQEATGLQYDGAAVIRADSSQKKLALCFITGSKGAGLKTISQILSSEKTRASFFFTSEFLEKNLPVTSQLKAKHYIGSAGSEQGWVGEYEFIDMQSGSANPKMVAKPVLPGKILLVPNSSYAVDSTQDVISIAPTSATALFASAAGSSSLAYINSDSLFQTIMDKARQMPYGFNCCFLVIPTEAAADRPDKFYMLLPLLLQELKNEGYQLMRADEMLGFKVPQVYFNTVKKKTTTSKKKAIPSKNKRRR